VEARVVPLGPQLLGALDEPLHVLEEDLAVLADLLDAVDERVGQNGDALDEHLLGVVVAVVAGLAEDRHRLRRGLGAQRICHDVRLRRLLGFSSRSEQRLRDAVADRRVESVAVNFHLLEQFGVVEELGRIPALEFVGDGTLDDDGGTPRL